jgi:hypothetical protein
MPNEPVTFDRPDRDNIDIIKDAAGRIISAQRRDYSILAYLLRIGLADHGHEASATTFLDWQLAYTSIRGMKVASYGQHDGGDGGSEKASKYLRLIRKLGRDAQKTVEFCIGDQDQGVRQMIQTAKTGTPREKNRVIAQLDVIFRRAVSALDRLGRAIHETKEEFKAEEQAELSGDDKNSLARIPELR